MKPIPESSLKPEIKICPSGHEMYKKFIRGEKYFYCPSCNKKYELPFPYLLGDRPTLKSVFKSLIKSLNS